MRPNTLADAVDRIISGETRDIVFAEFVDVFLLAPDSEAQFATIEREPARTNDDRLDALVGAMAEYMAKQHRTGRLPSWVSQSWRRLAEPWFTTSSDAPAMREYLTFASPAEFASRNIFTEERPLRRARATLWREPAIKPDP